MKHDIILQYVQHFSNPVQNTFAAIRTKLEKNREHEKKQKEKTKRWARRIHKAWIDYRILHKYSFIRIFGHSLIQIIRKRQVQRP